MSEDEDFEELDLDLEESLSEESPKKEYAPDSKVALFFRSTIGPGEQERKMMVDPNMSVENLKQKIGEYFGLDTGDFHISIGGRTLDSDDVLSNYNLEDGTECLIIPVSQAGLSLNKTI